MCYQIFPLEVYQMDWSNIAHVLSGTPLRCIILLLWILNLHLSRCQKVCTGIMHFLSHHILMKNIGICNLFQENHTMISHFMKIKNVDLFEGNYEKQFDNMFHFVGGVGVNLNIWLGNVGRNRIPPLFFIRFPIFFGNFELWLVRSHKEWADSEFDWNLIETLRCIKFARNRIPLSREMIKAAGYKKPFAEFAIINQSFTSNL